MKRLIALLLLTAACGPRYEGIELTLHSEPPAPVLLDDQEIEVPVGIAVAVDVKPLSSGRFEYLVTDQLDLRSQDRDVLRVEPTENGRRFVFVGVAAGETCVEIEVDYDEHGCIPARVVAQ